MHDENEILREILEELQDENSLLRLVAAEQIASKQLLQTIANNTQPKPVYSVRLTQLPENTMAIGNITAGTTGQIGAALLDNGAPVAGFTGTFTFTASDTTVTFAPATTDASGGTIPLANQTVISVPAGDPGTSVTVTATTTAPDGTTATGTLTIALTPVAQQFTVGLTQLV
jgi:hypothetical protein